MPLIWMCTCGRPLRVAEQYAGQLVKCPACLTIGPAPKPEQPEEVIVEGTLTRPAPEPEGLRPRHAQTFGRPDDTGDTGPTPTLPKSTVPRPRHAETILDEEPSQGAGGS